MDRLGGIRQNIFQGRLPPGLQATLDEATTGSLRLAGQGLERELGTLGQQSQMLTGRAIRDIRGGFGGRGLRGGVGSGQIAETIAQMNLAQQNLAGRGQQQLGQLGIEGMRTRASGILQGQGLMQQGLLGLGGLELGQLGQQIGLRGQAAGGRALALSNPLLNQLFQRELATASRQQTGTSYQTQMGTESGGPNAFGGILGGLGSQFLGAGLGQYL
jgi:hypothetical protein